MIQISELTDIKEIIIELYKQGLHDTAILEYLKTTPHRLPLPFTMTRKSILRYRHVNGIIFTRYPYKTQPSKSNLRPRRKSP